VEAIHAGLRAEAFLALKCPTISRTRLKQKIMTGEVRVNGNRLATSTRLRAGDLLELDLREEPGPPAELEVLYEDASLLAVNKPAGLAIHPAGGRLRGTLIQSVRQAFRAQIQRSLEAGDPDFYPSLVHRRTSLSGVVLIARPPDLVAAPPAGRRGFQALSRPGMRRGPSTGSPRGRIEVSARTSAGADPRCIRPDGLPAVTEYEVLERLAGHTLLAVYPLTGRQHQIRVHLASIGHPLWGDLIYQDESLFLRYAAGLDSSLPPRHGLHAERARFLHPASGQELELCAPLPEDLGRVVADQRRPGGPQAGKA
jgi:23S rRNA pseudouridine1911/1915/1917 synthase